MISEDKTVSELIGAAWPTTQSNAASQPDVDVDFNAQETNPYADVATAVVAPATLEAATRLVDPMRLNNLMPEDITRRHLRKAKREVQHARRNLQDIQQTSVKLLQLARGEAQLGQQLARMAPGQRRAKQVQRAVLRMKDLRAYHAALLDECTRFTRRIAAASDLASAWDGVHIKKRITGQSATQGLRQMALTSAREEHFARNLLNDLERALRHTAVAEDAMRRDSQALRLDPVNFARAAGRARKRVRLGIVAVLIAFLILIFPPWSPPHIALGCSIPSQEHTCSQVPPSSNVLITNTGLGTLIGWMTITTQQSYTSSTQVMPLVVLPHASRSLSCGDLGSCAFETGTTAQVDITSTGGSFSLTIVP